MEKILFIAYMTGVCFTKLILEELINKCRTFTAGFTSPNLSFHILFLTNGILAQVDADSLKISSFRKGRNLWQTKTSWSGIGKCRGCIGLSKIQRRGRFAVSVSQIESYPDPDGYRGQPIRRHRPLLWCKRSVLIV